MLKLFKRFRPIDWLIIFVLIVFVVTQVYFDVTLPEYTTEIVNKIRIPGTTTSAILKVGLKMLAYALGSTVCTIIVGYIAAHLAAKFSSKLRKDIFNKIQSFSFAETNKFSTPSLITRSTNDVQQVQMAVIMILRLAISAPVTAVWAILKINASSSTMTIATAAFICVLIIFISVLFIVVMPKFQKMQKLTDKLNGVTRENLTGLRVVKAYNADQYQEAKFEKTNVDIANLNLFTNRIMGLMNPVMLLIMHGLILTVYWLGSQLINEKILDLGIVMAFSMLTMQVLMAFMMLLMLFIMVPRAEISARRINEILNEQLSIIDPDTENTFPIESIGEVVFKNVSFKYPGAEDYVLKDISFTARKGETVAIIGSTGSGKSTLINLIPRFYDATEGEVIVNGVNIKNVKQETLRKKIGYIPQKGVLFSGTIRSNITYGKDCSDDKIQEVATIAMAEEFIENMNDKYDSIIAQGGKNVSGGQKQRLSIARAIAIDPDIFIFDDSFSALDFKTDKALRSNLKKYAQKITNIIVAQRIGTIIEADKIIVLEQGKMVGCGTHKELLENCPVYKEIALSQLKAEELGI